MGKGTSGAIAVVDDNSRDFNLKSEIVLGTIGKITKAKMENDEEIKIKEWGNNNDAPTKREELLRALGITGALLATKRNMTVGLELFTYKNRYEKNAKGEMVVIRDEVPMPDDIKVFYKLSGGKKYFRQASQELFKHANIFTEFIPDGVTASGTATANMFSHCKVQPCRFIRAEQMNEEGKIENFYWRGDAWQARSDEGRTFLAKRIAAYDEDLPLEEQNMDGFIFHTGEDLFSDEYYFIPSFEGLYEVMGIALRFPKLHKSNLTHGLGVRQHAEFNSDYFDQMSVETAQDTEGGTTEGSKLDADLKIEKGTSLVDTVKEFLSGEENFGKTLITEFTFDEATGKEISDVKINAIKGDIKDEALIKLMEAIYKMIISGFQVHPTLANIETAGRLSSGTEMRNAYNMWIAVHASTFRDILLEPFYLAKDLNGWDADIEFGFRDAVMTTLSDEPTGQKKDSVTQ
jgi:hypothetical protein